MLIKILIKIFVEKNKKQFFFKTPPPPPKKKSCLHEMWKNIVQPARPQMTI